MLLGQASLAERLDGVLAEIAPAVRSGDLVEYWFSHDASIDRGFLADLRAARAAGLQLHLATEQEHGRARYLWETLNLKADFEQMHYSADIGHVKTEESFYRAVELAGEFAPDELLLIDDQPKNVDAARRAGWRAHLWAPASRLSDVPALTTWSAPA